MDVTDLSAWRNGQCKKCGFTEEDTGLHIFQLHSDRFRLRGMIAYAKDAPDFTSCKYILADALDGVNGAENYEEVKGEREALRARINDLIIDCAAWKSCSDAGDDVIGELRAELTRLHKAVEWTEDYLMGTIPKYGEAARNVDALEELRKMVEGASG